MFPVLEIFCWRKCDKPAVVHYWNQNTLWHFHFHVYNDSILVVHPPGLIFAACSSEDWGLAVILRTFWWWRVRGAWQHGNRTASDGWMMMMIRTATRTPSSVDLPLWTLSCESWWATHLYKIFPLNPHVPVLFLEDSHISFGPRLPFQENREKREPDNFQHVAIYVTIRHPISGISAKICM